MTTLSDGHLWETVRDSVRAVPTDLVLLLLYLALGDALLLQDAIARPVRTVVGMPILLFFPGYALVAALFPKQNESVSSGIVPFDKNAGKNTTHGLGLAERVALSFGLSIALLPLFGIGLSVVGLPLDGTEIIQILTVTVVVLTLGAAVRRLSVSPRERFRLPFDQWLGGVRNATVRAPSALDAILNVVLALGIVLAFTSLGLGLVTPTSGESYTQFQLLTTNETDDYTAAGYPQTMDAGEPRSLVANVVNEEGKRTTYTVVVQLQRVEETDGQLTVQERQTVKTLEYTLNPNESVYDSHAITPRMAGDDLRLTYLLYTGSPPSTPTIQNSYRHTYLWVNVTRPTSSSGMA